MLKKILYLLILLLVFLAGCQFDNPKLHIKRVGMLVEGDADEHTWNEKGMRGIESIKEAFDVKVYVEENVETIHETWEAVEELSNKGVNLIFGHSSSYGEYFQEIAEHFPKIHFVYFNGTYASKNLTSLNFDSHAAGFFAGMIASKMSTSNHVGIIGAYEWQPEIEGFFEGAKYQNKETKVAISYVDNWNAFDAALETYRQMKEANVDVFYPAGDMYSNEIIELAKADNLYAIGFVADQNKMAEETVLTSTVQDVDKLYLHIARKFNNKELTGGVKTYDFADRVIYLGEFSEDVPDDYIQSIKEMIDIYIETNHLPNE